jgi:hypothetical protein
MKRFAELQDLLPAVVRRGIRDAGNFTRRAALAGARA